MQEKKDTYSGRSADEGDPGESNKNISKPGKQAGGSAAAGTATARSFYDQAKETAGQAYETVTDKAAVKLTEQKHSLTDSLTNVADSVRQMGTDLEGSGNEGITAVAAKYSGVAARGLEQTAGYFERKTIREMLRDLESFARRNPAAFIGGAFVSGLLVARFLKSSAPDSVMKADGDTFKTAATGAGEDASELDTRRDPGVKARADQ